MSNGKISSEMIYIFISKPSGMINQRLYDVVSRVPDYSFFLFSPSVYLFSTSPNSN